LSEPPETRDFFISFNKADRPAATWIAWVLEKVGAHHVYFQDWDFRGNFVDHMNQGVQRCPRCVAVLSDNYFGSGFTLAEWSAYFQLDPANRASTIIPVRVGPVSEENLLAPLIYADLTDCDEATAEARLLEHVRKAIDPTFRPVPNDRPPFWRHSPKPTFPHLTKSLATHNLPPRNPDFVGRSAALQAIKAALTAPNDPPLVVTQAITGLGGVGKTQTALAFAHAQLAERRLVWWLDAEEPAKLASDYATLARPLGLREADNQAALNARVRETLQQGDGWLLVFDNAEDRAVIRPYLPASGQGLVLITSRRSDWRGLARTLPLDVMSEPDALRLLSGMQDPEATLPAAGLAEAKALAEELGFLPLALAQARAFMTERGYGFADYRMLFAERLIEVMERGADGLDPTIDKTADPATRKRQRAVAVTWDISIEAAAEQAPGARELLELLACFAPEPLPREILAARPEVLPEHLRDTFARDDALAALVRFSLTDATERGITTHRLVQAIIRETLKRGDLTTFEARAAGAVSLLLEAMPAHSPQDPRSWDHYRRMLPHHLVSAKLAESVDAALENIGFVLNEAALYLMARASYAEAEPLFERAIDFGHRTLEPFHPALLVRLHNLAFLRHRLGRSKEAEILYRYVIHFGEQTYDRDIANWLGNLANLLQGTGRLREAEPLYQRAIYLGKLNPQPNYPEIAQCLSSLACLYDARECFGKAQPLHREAIGIGRRTLPPDHPDLAVILNSLGEHRRANGHPAKAERHYRRAIGIAQKKLGGDHPYLAVYLGNLANLFYEARRFAEAEPLYQSAIEIVDIALPPDHPQQALIRENFAILLDDLGRSHEAAALRARAQAVRDARAAAGR
jgi:tetratricopeptide (TPR) repeat protein